MNRLSLVLVVAFVRHLDAGLPYAGPLRSRNVYTESYDDASTVGRVTPLTDIHIGGLFPITGESKCNSFRKDLHLSEDNNSQVDG